MEKGAFSSLEEDGFDSATVFFQRSLDLRYRGQAFELNLPFEKGDSIKGVEGKFHQRFQETYGHSHPGHSLELVNLRLSSFGVVNKPVLPPSNSGGLLWKGLRRMKERFFPMGSSGTRRSLRGSVILVKEYGTGLLSLRKLGQPPLSLRTGSLGWIPAEIFY